MFRTEDHRKLFHKPLQTCLPHELHVLHQINTRVLLVASESDVDAVTVDDAFYSCGSGGSAAVALLDDVLIGRCTFYCSGTCREAGACCFRRSSGETGISRGLEHGCAQLLASQIRWKFFNGFRGQGCMFFGRALHSTTCHHHGVRQFVWI